MLFSLYILFWKGGKKVKAFKKKKGNIRKKELIFIWGMLALPLLQWLIFWVGINANYIKLAFLDARTNTFTFYNFVTFWNDLTAPAGSIKIALVNTLKYFAATMLIINPLSLAIAYFLYRKIRGYKVFRVIFYLPAIISAVVMVECYRGVIQPRGAVDMIMHLFGKSIPSEGWLANFDTATGAILFFTVWTGFGVNVLLFMGAMVRVPTEMLEAARLDGCTSFREFFTMILPMIMPTISTLIITSFTGVVAVTGPILLFTNGGYNTTTIAFWIFEKIYGGGVSGGLTANYNIVSCTGLCFTLISLPIIFLIRYLMDKIPVVEY